MSCDSQLYKSQCTQLCKLHRFYQRSLVLQCNYQTMVVSHETMAKQQLLVGWCKTWTLDSGLDCGLRIGLMRFWMTTISNHFAWTVLQMRGYHRVVISPIVHGIIRMAY